MRACEQGLKCIIIIIINIDILLPFFPCMSLELELVMLGAWCEVDPWYRKGVHGESP